MSHTNLRVTPDLVSFLNRIETERNVLTTHVLHFTRFKDLHLRGKPGIRQTLKYAILNQQPSESCVINSERRTDACSSTPTSHGSSHHHWSENRLHLTSGRHLSFDHPRCNTILLQYPCPLQPNDRMLPS